MRFTPLLLGCALLLSACKSHKTDGTQPKPGPRERVTVTPVSAIKGKVVVSNTTLRYVVVDFSLGPAPAVNQKLFVYRKGMKVAELKVSNVSQNNNFAADVSTGDAAVGDEVRDE